VYCCKQFLAININILILIEYNVVFTILLHFVLLCLYMHVGPFDDSENLSVFLIVLENPLLLRPAAHHVALERVVSGILAIPRTYRVMFFGWMRHYPSEYFSHVVLVMQSYLSFILKDKVTRLDPTPVVLVLERWVGDGLVGAFLGL
jgi:hypothetical protein